LVFSSVTFLFYFFPIVLFLYYCLPIRNAFLLFASLFFYAWGESSFVSLLLVSIAVNYLAGILIDSRRSELGRRFALASGVAANLGLLGFFKYANFLVENIDWLLVWLNIRPIEFQAIHLPLGISFFTFQAISYLVDVYRRVSKAEHDPLTLGLFISMFPQLVAGPIVRFHDIADQLHERFITHEAFADGIRRFVVGLGQKVLIANTLAIPADAIFKIPSENLTTGLAWLGVSSYTLQIYFDFAGYSNMAIGLGLMFGFRLPENFNYPYISQSITEFWRRWHMSLSTWFRDYLYIPLGGNRRGLARTYVNLVIVFFLCGLWHGASWTFVVWGLFHGAFLVLERVGLGRWLRTIWRPLRYIYTLLVVSVAWVFFRSDDFGFAADFLSALAGVAQGDGLMYSAKQFLNREVVFALTLGAVGSAPVIPAIRGALEAVRPSLGALKKSLFEISIRGVETFILICIFAFVAMNLAAKTHNPFIYFRF
jgi:alginate O-acetyltransferase complex protein AlgI